MGYLHLEIEGVSVPKKQGGACGDDFIFERTAAHTTLVLADGIGSGIKANLAAGLCISRFQELLRQGFSLRDSFVRVVKTLNESKKPGEPYAALTALRVLNDGAAVVLSYEMPPPLFVSSRQTFQIPSKAFFVDDAEIHESNYYLEEGEGILLVSDGVTLAGAGAGLPRGWTIQGVGAFLNEILTGETPLQKLPLMITRKALELWGKVSRDDTTAVAAWCRKGHVVNILTGPPKNSEDDYKTINKFKNLRGWKIICGGTTSSVYAKQTGKKVNVNLNSKSMIAPPDYEIEGVDLVTEGAVTLNQAYNVLDEQPDELEPDTGVTELCHLLNIADKVNFIIGGAENPANKAISFRQQGILSRNKIIPLIAKKLRSDGKLVVIENV